MEAAVSRYDFAPIVGSEITEEGYLRVWCRASRTGIQIYKRSDGSTVREYRPPEEVGNPESIATFGMKPVTWNHPPVLLDSNNTKDYLKGYSGSQARWSDGFVEVALTITDEETIKRVKNKEATQVSAGYKVDYDDTPGVTPQGEHYDGVQRNIRVNHIAIVPRGRAGPEVRLLLDRMDAADAVAIDSDEEVAQQPSVPRTQPMALVKLDGMELELPNEVAPSVSLFAQNASQKIADLGDQLAAAKARVDSLEAELSNAQEEREAAEGRCDSLEERIEELEAGSGSRIDAAELDQLVAARLGLLQKLAPAFSEDFKFDGKNDEELYTQAFTNLVGSAPDKDADPGYIVGVVDGILLSRQDSESDEEDEEDEEDEDEKEDRSDSSDSSEPLRRAVQGVRRQDGQDSRQRYHVKVTSGWQKSLTAVKK